MGLSETVIRNPVIAWRNEARPDSVPQPVPPPWDAGIWEVTRSEIVIRPQGAVVHIWYAAIPAERD
jgi:hypothetical protein